MTKRNVLPIAFVHGADFDGMCCAALLNKYFDNQIEIHPLNYGDKELKSDTAFLDAFDVKNRDVYVCDFHFKPSLLKKVVDLSHLTTWLDHHKSAIDEIIKTSWYKRRLKSFINEEESENTSKLTGIWYGDSELPFSGAYLTWAWFFNKKDPGFTAIEGFDENGNITISYNVSGLTDNANSPWEKTSQVIRNIAIGDTHNLAFGFGAETEIFQYGMKALGLNFDTLEMWRALLSDLDNDESISYELFAKKNELIDKINILGEAVYQYNQVYEFSRINKNVFHIKLPINGKNIKILALNVNGYNSEVFEPIYNPETEDAFLAYFFKNDHWSYSVYVPEDKKDKVSAIDIIKYIDPEKGGGHKGAAGGSSEKLLKELQK